MCRCAYQLCMYICMHTCVYARVCWVCVSEYLCNYVFVYYVCSVYVCLFFSTCVRVYTCVYVYMCTCMCCVCMSVYKCIYVYVCLCMFIVCISVAQETGSMFTEDADPIRIHIRRVQCTGNLKTDS